MLGEFDCILLDIDGTLVDSNDAHASAWVDALARHGRSASFEIIRPLIGKGGDKVLRESAALDIESDLGRRISESRKQIFRSAYLPTVQPTAGAMELLAWLRRSGKRIVVATSAQRSELEGLLAIVDGQWLIGCATSSDDAERSKPDPDIVQAALEKSKCSAARTVLIGDTPYDIEAAARSGVRTIALRCGGWTDAHLTGAIGVFQNPAELVSAIEREDETANDETA